eukprot:6459900-Amphidinium_carterae.3
MFSTTLACNIATEAAFMLLTHSSTSSSMSKAFAPPQNKIQVRKWLALLHTTCVSHQTSCPRNLRSWGAPPGNEAKDQRGKCKSFVDFTRLYNPHPTPAAQIRDTNSRTRIALSCDPASFSHNFYAAHNQQACAQAAGVGPFGAGGGGMEVANFVVEPDAGKPEAWDWFMRASSHKTCTTQIHDTTFRKSKKNAIAKLFIASLLIIICHLRFLESGIGSPNSCSFLLPLPCQIISIVLFSLPLAC